MYTRDLFRRFAIIFFRPFMVSLSQLSSQALSASRSMLDIFDRNERTASNRSKNMLKNQEEATIRSSSPKIQNQDEIIHNFLFVLSVSVCLVVIHSLNVVHFCQQIIIALNYWILISQCSFLMFQSKRLLKSLHQVCHQILVKLFCCHFFMVYCK